jgi:cytochrome oxidase Cu insertion factor (SCO1/SenC/PrrC family)
MIRRSVLIGAVGAALGVAAGFVFLPHVGEHASHIVQQVSDKALVGGPFVLTGTDGKRVTEQDFRGKYMLVFFGYTSCPDICPTTLQLGPKADRITPIFISVDPERDTPDKLQAYVKSFDPRIVGVTGTPDEIAAAAKAYRVYYAKVPNKDKPDDYAIDHSSIIYVMDAKGQFVTHFVSTSSIDEMADKLDKLL